MKRLRSEAWPAVMQILAIYLQNREFSDASQYSCLLGVMSVVLIDTLILVMHKITI